MSPQLPRREHQDPANIVKQDQEQDQDDVQDIKEACIRPFNKTIISTRDNDAWTTACKHWKHEDLQENSIQRLTEYRSLNNAPGTASQYAGIRNL